MEFLAIVLIVVLNSMLVFRLAIVYEEQARTRPVVGQIPRSFPVVVFFDGTGQLVLHKNLLTFLKECPDCTFLVSRVSARQLSRQLKGLSSSGDLGSGPGRFDVKQLPGGRQLFKVEDLGDSDRVSISWYEADARDIKPLRYLTYFGPGIVMMYAPVVLIADAFLVTAVVVVYRRRGKKSERAENE